MSFVPVIALIEEEYANYVFSCRQLCLDPSKVYEQAVIDKRVDDALAEIGIDKKTAKKLTWFRKKYGSMEGGVLGNKYVTRARKEIEKGKLVLDYEVVD